MQEEEEVTFICNQTFDTKHICCLCFQSFCITKALERGVNDSFEINCKQTKKLAKKGETVKLENYTKNKLATHDLC